MAQEENKLILSESELSMVPDKILNKDQMQMLLKRTPKKYIKKRPAKGGGQWDYVTGGYVKKVLNIMFGFNWSFNILEQIIAHGEVVVKGRLTVISNDQTIVKEQFGNKEIVYRKATESGAEPTPLSIGNDMKAAATDALKKCAAEIGIAADIYNKEEFREVEVREDTPEALREEIMEMLLSSEFKLVQKELARINEIVQNREEASYKKAIERLKKTRITKSET